MTAAARIAGYNNSVYRGNRPLLDEIEREARAANVPVIRQEAQAVLRLLLAMRKPRRILEVGCATGFSALLMCENAPEGCRITTIEKYEKRIPKARENFARAGREGQITLLEGDAAQILPGLSGSYDFIFMDAAKGQYLHFFPEVMRLLGRDGVLVCDNVLQDGDVAESRFAVERRNRTIHSRMREYLYELTHAEELRTAVLSVGDGIPVSTRL